VTIALDSCEEYLQRAASDGGISLVAWDLPLK
jgi:hypothetical protein